jgi:hypothetical protein
MSELSKYEDEAREMGRRDGLDAASWVIDGNTSAYHIEKTIKGLENGDPEAYDLLSALRPDLSGQWADDLTPGTLAYYITDMDSDDPGFDQIADALADAYEEGVDETFEIECDRILRAALAK